MSRHNEDCDEVLVELSNAEIEECRKFFKNLDQLEYVYVHLYLKNQLRWNQMMSKMKADDVAQISDRCKMKFYRHRSGKAENKTLLGITGEKEFSIFVITLEESSQELRECLEKSTLINWDLCPLFVAVHSRFHEMIFEIFEQKNVKVRFDNRTTTFWLDRREALQRELPVFNDVELKELNISDYKMINDVWPYKYDGSECFIKSLITLSGGLGIYQRGKLLSWILQIECFGMGLLQTLDEYQGQGYARILTHAMAKRISERYDEDVILFASHSKPKTVELYKRYGYQHVSYAHWFYLKKD